jgi:hypothetical protein
MKLGRKLNKKLIENIKKAWSDVEIVTLNVENWFQYSVVFAWMAKVGREWSDLECSFQTQ